MGSIKPQLQSIHHCLTAATLSYLHDGPKEHAADVFSLVQQLSPACRAARMEAASSLVTAKVLGHIDDIDSLKCRSKVDTQLKAFAMLALAVPVLLSVFSMYVSDLGLSLILPTALAGIVIGASWVYSSIPLALLVPAVFVAGLFLFRQVASLYGLRRAHVGGDKAVQSPATTPTLSNRRWHRSQRSQRRGRFFLLRHLQSSMGSYVKRLVIQLQMFTLSQLKEV